MTAPRSRAAAADTRERILRESAALFARRGYVGTSTRAITRAVGISQPSLFHHFATKQAIVEALLAIDLLPATGFAKRLAAMDGPAGPRLYTYVLGDTQSLLSSPYQLGGLYTDDVMRAPEFAGYRRRRNELHSAIADVIAQGVEAADFLDLDPHVVRRIITSMNLMTIDIRRESRRPPEDLSSQAADFVLRAVLTRPARLPAIRNQARLVQAELDALPR